MTRRNSSLALPEWARRCLEFLQSMEGSARGVYRSVPGGPETLYGTCYSWLAQHYLGSDESPGPEACEFILDGQDPDTGLFTGPELRDFKAAPGARHDREHLLLHLTCAALPVCQQFGIPARHPIRAARRFCDLKFLKDWLDSRNLVEAWFEGNNLLFVGQLLIHLRDVELVPEAIPALDLWFEWLDRNVDPATGLWGTNGYCSPAEAVYGGYHQLLVYYYEARFLTNIRGLVDTALSLQHADGGFHPNGNGGACEDVDSVDILVNCYKRLDYRRPEIRVALRRCLRHILGTQNPDGGFPYNRNVPQSHMGVPGTQAPPNVSTMFPTWFRVHTLALIAQILGDEPALRLPFRFSRALSMGWHDASNPPALTPLTPAERRAELPARARAWVAQGRHQIAHSYHRARRLGGRVLRRLRLRSA
jgi:hypothetical protein